MQAEHIANEIKEEKGEKFIVSKEEKSQHLCPCGRNVFQRPFHAAICRGGGAV